MKKSLRTTLKLVGRSIRLVVIFSMLYTNIFAPLGVASKVLAEDFTDNTWTSTESGAFSTVDNVVVGKEYVVPQLGGLKVVFSQLPETSGRLYANAVSVPEEINGMKTVSTGYEIKSDMVDGTFKYDLYLPKSSQANSDVQVLYSEDGATYNEVANEQVQSDYVLVSGLDHFTVFVQVDPTTAASTDWSNVNYVFASDNQYAKYTMPSMPITFTTRVSNNLTATGFSGMSAIPNNAIITGIQVNIEAKYENNVPLPSLSNSYDYRVSLIKGGVVTSYNAVTSHADYTSSDVVRTYGTTSSLWGSTWTPADLKAANFGVALQVARDYPATIQQDVKVDHMDVKVTYMTPPTLSFTNPAASAILKGGAVQNVTWTVTDPDAGDVSTITLDYSLNGGATWTNLLTNAANTGTFAWTVPSADVNNAQLRATAKDKDNLTSTDTKTFVIDSTNPVITFVDNVVAGPVQLDNVSATVVDANLSTAAYGFSSDNVCDATENYLWTYTSGAALTFSDETHNNQYVCFRGVDAVGHTTYAQSANKLNIDITAPAVPYPILPVDKTFINAGFEQTWFHATDATQYEYQSCYVDPRVTPCPVDSANQRFHAFYNPTDHKIVGTTEQGRLWWRLRARDLAGNWSVWSDPFELTIDYVAPSSSFGSPTAGSYYNSAITLSGQSVDTWAVKSVDLFYSPAGANTWTKITTLNNAAINTPYNWNYAWTPSAEGKYDLKVTATDAAGNLESTAYVLNVTYDVTAPVVPGQMGWASTLTPPATTYTGNGVGMANYVTCGGYITQKIAYNGVWGGATDNVAGLDHYERDVYYNGVYQGSYNASANYAGPFTPFDGLGANGGNGVYSVRVRAVDKSGNKSIDDTTWSNKTPNASWCTATIDTIAPAAFNLLTLPDGSSTKENGGSAHPVSVTWSQSSDVNFDHYEYQAVAYNPAVCASASAYPYVNSSFVGVSSTSFLNNFYANPDGKSCWRVYAVDKAGNRTLATTGTANSFWTLTIDRTAPSVPNGLHFNLPNGTELTCGASTNSFNIKADWNDSTDNLSGIKQYQYHINYPKTDGTRADWSTTVPSSEYNGVFNAGQGVHTYSVRSMDGATVLDPANEGNWSAWSEPCSITYDSKAPIIVADSSVHESNGYAYLNSTAHDDFSPILNIKYTVYDEEGVADEGSFVDAYGTYGSDTDVQGVAFFDTTTINPGIAKYYPISICAIDTLGNEGTGTLATLPTTQENPCYTFELYIDNQKPVVDEENQPKDLELNEGQDFPAVTVGAIDDSALYSINLQVTLPNDTTVNDTVLVDDGMTTWNLTEILKAVLGTGKVDTSVLDEGVYNVTYNFEDVHGNVSDDYSFIVTILNVNPALTFAADQTINEGQTASFTASFEDPSCIKDEEGICVNLGEVPDDAQWTATVDYGDETEVVTLPGINTPGEISIPDHAYVNAGSYTVTLMVCENAELPGEGMCDSKTVVVTVDNVVPTVAVTPTPVTITTAQTSVLTANVTSGNAPYTYTWSCTNSQTGTAQALTFANAATGSFVCTVTVTDVDGDTATNTANLTVNAVPVVVVPPVNNGGQVLGAQTQTTPTTPTEEDKGEVKGETTKCTANSKVTGHVYFDKNNNGKYDEGEQGTLLVEVQMMGKDNDGKDIVLTSTKTDTKGDWSMDVCTGTYNFRINPNDLPGNVKVTPSGMLEVKIDNENSQVNAEFKLETQLSFFEMYWWLLLLIAAGVVGGGYFVAKRRTSTK